jgi:hypothetical protein
MHRLFVGIDKYENINACRRPQHHLMVVRSLITAAAANEWKRDCNENEQDVLLGILWMLTMLLSSGRNGRTGFPVR